jgi:hypothetical protein
MKIEMEFNVRRHAGNFHPRWRIARDAGRLSRDAGAVYESRRLLSSQSESALLW